MTHARTIIRKTVISLLKNSTFGRNLGEKIYESRVYPIDNPPAILVYTPQEQVTEYTISYPRHQMRQLTLVVEAYAKTQASIDETTDSLALEIEEILSADHTLGGMVKDVALTSTETTSSGDGDKPIGVATLTYHITYCVKENAANKLI